MTLNPHILDNLNECIDNAFYSTKETTSLFKALTQQDISCTGKVSNIHFTSSSFIINETHDKVLLLYHNSYKKWLQFGGHWNEDLDNQETIAQGAIREMFEEAFDNQPIDYKLLNSSFPLDLDIHTAKSHLHYDVCFLIEVNENTPFKLSKESTTIKWVTIEDILKNENKEFNDRLIRMSLSALQVTSSLNNSKEYKKTM